MEPECRFCKNPVNTILKNYQQCCVCKDIKCNECIDNKKCRKMIKVKTKNALLLNLYCIDCYFNVNLLKI